MVVKEDEPVSEGKAVDLSKKENGVKYTFYDSKKKLKSLSKAVKKETQKHAPKATDVNSKACLNNDEAPEPDTEKGSLPSYEEVPVSFSEFREEFSDRLWWKGKEDMEAEAFKDRRVVDSLDGIMPLALQEEAKKDIFEDQSEIQNHITEFRKLVEEQPKLNLNTNQAFLLMFLRARKFNHQEALQMLLGYYEAQRKLSKSYENLVPSVLDHVWSLKLITVLPLPDRLSRTVILLKAGSWKPHLCDIEDLFIRAQILILEHIVRLPATQLFGISVLVDCGGLTMGQALYFTPRQIRKIVFALQEVFPLRFKSLHFINEPALFDWLFSIAKPFLSEVIKGRIFFHGSRMESLSEHVSKQCLPKEYGGDQPLMDNTFLVVQLKANEEYFKEHFNYGHLKN